MEIFALIGLLIIYAAVKETACDIATWWRKRKQPNSKPM